MKKIGFVTSTEDPDLTADDKLAIPTLAKLGFSVLPVVWSGLGDFANLDGLICRSLGPVLIELEVTDPMLFLTQEFAITNFVNAVSEVL